MSISTHAARTPDKPAAIMAGSGATLSFGELEASSCRLARLFHASGLNPGDRVAILMENDPTWFVVMWACRRAALFFVPVNWHLKPAEIRYVVENSDARALITSDRLIDAARETAEGLSDLVLRLKTGPAVAGFDALDDMIARFSPQPLENEREGGSMMYSSGTSGQPKGIVRALTGEPFGTPSGLERLLGVLYGLDERTIYLSPAPQYHAAPVGWTMAVQIAGGTAVVMESFDAEAVLRAIERYRITHAQFVPTHFVRLLKLPAGIRARYDLSSLTTVIHAAAPCPPDIKRQMMEWLGPIVHEYYGGSERCGLTAIGPNDWLKRPGSVGQARLGSIRIADPESGAELPLRATGLVYFAGGGAFRYHKDEAKTRESQTAAGWGTYGDMGWVDEEGFLFLADRRSNMIISGGVNIYPQEVEDFLISHPAVADAAVIGVPNDEFGEEVRAVVVPMRAGDAGPNLAATLIAACRERFAGYKCPRSVDFVAELPRHPNGKLLKRTLRGRYWPAEAR